MTDALVSVGAALLLACVALTGLGLLTLLPFVTAVGLAERAGVGTVRWGMLAVGGGGAGVLAVLKALRSGPSPGLLVLGVVLAWAVPLVLLLPWRSVRLSGVRGRHE